MKMETMWDSSILSGFNIRKPTGYPLINEGFTMVGPQKCGKLVEVQMTFTLVNISLI